MAYHPPFHENNVIHPSYHHQPISYTYHPPTPTANMAPQESNESPELKDIWKALEDVTNALSSIKSNHPPYQPDYYEDVDISIENGFTTQGFQHALIIEPITPFEELCKFDFDGLRDEVMAIGKRFLSLGEYLKGDPSLPLYSDEFGYEELILYLSRWAC
jgi:hypothetical protein